MSDGMGHRFTKARAVGGPSAIVRGIGASDSSHDVSGDGGEPALRIELRTPTLRKSCSTTELSGPGGDSPTTASDARQETTRGRWKQCRRAPLYEVNEAGQVRCCETGLVRKPSRDGRGYTALSLSNGEGRKKTVRVHLLVADAFLGPCPDGMEVNHVDGDKKNPALSNLEYVSHAENQKHAFATGLQVSTKGSRHGRSKLTEEKVRELRENPRKHKLREWARLFGVSLSTVCLALNGKSWSHVAVSR